MKIGDKLKERLGITAKSTVVYEDEAIWLIEEIWIYRQVPTLHLINITNLLRTGMTKDCPIRFFFHSCPQISRNPCLSVQFFFLGLVESGVSMFCLVLFLNSFTSWHRYSFFDRPKSSVLAGFCSVLCSCLSVSIVKFFCFL